MISSNPITLSNNFLSTHPCQIKAGSNGFGWLIVTIKMRELQKKSKVRDCSTHFNFAIQNMMWKFTDDNTPGAVNNSIEYIQKPSLGKFIWVVIILSVRILNFQHNLSLNICNRSMNDETLVIFSFDSLLSNSHLYHVSQCNYLSVLPTFSKVILRIIGRHISRMMSINTFQVI